MSGEEQGQFVDSETEFTSAGDSLHQESGETGIAQETSAEGEQKQKYVPYAAMKEERTKRQQRDRENEQLRSQLAHYERLAGAFAQGQTSVADKDPYTEDEVFSDLPGSLRKIEGRIMAKVEQERRSERFNQSEIAAQRIHADYDDAIEHFKNQMIKENPYLLEQMERHPSPAFFAYDTAKKDLDKQSEIEKHISAAIERERGKLLAQTAPPSLGGMRGGNAKSNNAVSGRRSLRDILGR